MFVIAPTDRYKVRQVVSTLQSKILLQSSHEAFSAAVIRHQELTPAVHRQKSTAGTWHTLHAYLGGFHAFEESLPF